MGIATEIGVSLRPASTSEGSLPCYHWPLKPIFDDRPLDRKSLKANMLLRIPVFLPRKAITTSIGNKTSDYHVASQRMVFT